MTVSYTADVANGSSFGCFQKILVRWRGSVYKLIWRELLTYLTLFYIIQILYRYALSENQQIIFEKIRNYFHRSTEAIPMSFVLGFYVALVVKRWWEQYRLLPWPDSLALFVSAAIPGVDERGRLMRRNIIRYSQLAYVITLHQVSLRVKKRFPTWQHMVDAGLMMESEKKIFEMMDEKSSLSKYWMPLIWATNIINRARKEGMVTSDHVIQSLLVELSDIRRRLGSLIGYDNVCVPLVYTQVVTLSVYSYFLSALLGRQTINVIAGDSCDHKFEEDIEIPVFTVLQFVFYVGWLKVAEVLINPFGEDDDDIELNWLIDRHIKAGYMIVDEMHEEHPELLKDQYWEEVVPKELPYTVASEHYRRTEPKGSAENYKVKEADSIYANLLPRKSVPHEDFADYESVDTPLAERKKNWFQRQIHRMGSVRSSSTTYSSGLFGRGRHNSVYSSPEAGTNGAPQPKMSLYDRLVGGRRSSHSRKVIGRQGTGKLNGSAIPVALKNRPRIPTPDVTKEVVDRENRLAIMQGNLGNGLSGNPLINNNQINNSTTQGYPAEVQGVPVLQVVLSPIQETEGAGNSLTHHSGQPGTAALAQAVLSPALTSAGLGPVTLNGTPVLTSNPVNMNTVNLAPVSMTQPILTSLGFNAVNTSASNSPQLHRFHFQHVPNQQIQTAHAPSVIVTELPSGTEEDSGSSHTGSVSGGDRSRKTSATSQSNVAKRGGEVYV